MERLLVDKGKIDTPDPTVYFKKILEALLNKSQIEFPQDFKKLLDKIYCSVDDKKPILMKGDKDDNDKLSYIISKITHIDGEEIQKLVEMAENLLSREKGNSEHKIY